MDKPGMMQAMVDALRNKVGLAPQQQQGPATDVAGNYRRYVMETQERGEQALPLREWQNTGATPR